MFSSGRTRLHAASGTGKLTQSLLAFIMQSVTLADNRRYGTKARMEIAYLIVAAGFVWLWLDSLRARDAARAAARAACESEGLLLLDDTVAIAALKPARKENGHLTLQRAYEFEYSDTGDNRRRGSLVLLGDRVILINLGVHDAFRP